MTEPIHYGTDVTGRPILFDQMTIDALEELKTALDGKQLTIFQGSYRPVSDYSADTHAGGGAIDCWVYGMTGPDLQKLMRQHHWAAFYRYPPAFGYHVHALLLGDPNLSAGAKAQVADYHAGRNGLIGHAPDPTWRPARITPYQEDTMPTPEDLWNHKIPVYDGKKGEQRQAHVVVAQAHNRAGDARTAARACLDGIQGLAKLVGDSKLTDAEKAQLADRIAKETADAVSAIDAATVAEHLEITPKEK